MLIERLIRIFTSLRLTVILLGLGLVLVFLGTLAQEPLGLYAAQNRFFRSFFVDANSMYAALHKTVDMVTQGFGRPLRPLDAHQLLTAPRFPVFPGGYLVGGLLLINLLAAHARYYTPNRKKIGIVFIHFGLVLLIFGQFLTDVLSVESTMHLRNGETKNYSEASRSWELAMVDTTDEKVDRVVAIPGTRLEKQGEITHAELPFKVVVREYLWNSVLQQERKEGLQQVQTSAGFGSGAWWSELPHETQMDRRDMPSGIVELVGSEGSLGTYLVSAFLARPQTVEYKGRVYEMSIRLRRYYKPFSLHLVEFRHDRYPGTDIPKNFSSTVRLVHPEKGENREFSIYMNNPLRYWGETYYQSGFDEDDQGTVLQVVRNPGWLTPYFSCVLVSAGLVIQFLTHLIGFAFRRKAS